MDCDGTSAAGKFWHAGIKAVPVHKGGQCWTKARSPPCIPTRRSAPATVLTDVVPGWGFICPADALRHRSEGGVGVGQDAGYLGRTSDGRNLVEIVRHSLSGC